MVFFFIVLSLEWGLDTYILGALFEDNLGYLETEILMFGYEWTRIDKKFLTQVGGSDLSQVCLSQFQNILISSR